MTKFELHITITTDNSTAISVLSEHCELSVTSIKQAINKGALWLTRRNKTQRFRRVKKALQLNDELHFYYNEAVLSQIPLSAKLISDNSDYSVWYKPYGMLSQGTKWSDHCSITRYVQQHLSPERPVYIVHRLDRAATGLIIVAHTKAAVKALTAMFEKRDSQLEKHYQIIVHGDHSAHAQPEIITAEIAGKKAQSQFNLLSYDKTNNLSLIAVKIASGRKHQIRLHAASVGLPVVGDRLHGDKTRYYPETLHLQLSAVSLSFCCPLSGEVKHYQLPCELMPNLEKVIVQLTQ